MVSAEVIRDTYIPCTLYVLFNISPDGLPLAGEREAIFFQKSEDRSQETEVRRQNARGDEGCHSDIASERLHPINAG